MATDTLQNLPNGEDVFVDANVFIYGLDGKSAQCKTLLQRCSREEVIGITSFHIVSEVTHRLMCEEARLKHKLTTNPRQKLAEHPEWVKALTDYWVNTQRLLSLNLLFLTVDEDTIRNAQAERTAAGLLNSDSIIISCMREYGITALASNDDGFSGVSGIALFKPTDI
jgi:predicted nucleic acid-binding protein